MEKNTNTTFNLQEIVNRHENVVSIKNLNYLYPNGHRMTNQMKWFKVCQDRRLRTN